MPVVDRAHAGRSILPLASVLVVKTDKRCAACLKAVARGMYCSTECKQLDAESLRKRGME